MDITLSHESVEKKLARIELDNHILRRENQNLNDCNDGLQSQVKWSSYSFSKLLAENRMLEKTLSLIDDAEAQSNGFRKDATIQTENNEMDDKEHANEFARPAAVRPTPISKCS